MQKEFFAKLLLSTFMSLISSFLSSYVKNFNFYQFLIAYVVVYIISLILSLILKRILRKKFQTQFWFLLSLFEIFMFFVIEFSILLYDKYTAMQRISNLNRIVYLFLRYFVVNELLIFEPLKIALISITYISNILVYFFLVNENVSIKNLISIFLEILSIILPLTVIEKSKEKGKLVDVLKQCFQCFFLIKNGEKNDLVHTQGAILNSLSSNEIHKIPKFTNLTKSYLNKFFLIERKFFQLNNLILMDDEIFNKMQDEEFIEYDINCLINNIHKFENGKDIRIKVKIKQNLSKSYIFCIKYIIDKGKKYILFTIFESESIKMNEKKETSYEMKIRELLIFHLKTLQKFVLKVQNSVQKLAGTITSDEEKMTISQALTANLKINLLKIENLLILMYEDYNGITLNLTKANIIAFVKDILNIMIPIAKARKIEINFSVDKFQNNLIIKFDLEKLRQVLLNLLLTSIKDALPNSTINFSVIFLGENIEKIQFIIQDPLLVMSQDRLNEIKSLMNGQTSHFELFGKNINLSVSQKLLSFLGGQKALNINSQIGQGSIYDLIVKPEKIYREIAENRKRFSLISCSKSDLKIETQTAKNQNNLNPHTNEFKSINSSIKKKEYLHLNKSKKINDYHHLKTDVKTNDFKTLSLNSSIKIDESSLSNQQNSCNNQNNLKKDSARNLIIDSSNLSSIMPESYNEHANCICKKILVICNNFFNLNLINQILASFKFECCSTENEETTIIKLISQNNCTDAYCGGFKVILIDCFPGEQCPSLIGKIKNMMDKGLINTIPVLGTGSLMSKDEIRRCLESGMTDFIPNPLNKNTVFNSFVKWTNLLTNKNDILID